jgi:hypothetical protein
MRSCFSIENFDFLAKVAQIAVSTYHTFHHGLSFCAFSVWASLNVG